MLILSRCPEESIIIDGTIKVKVLDCSTGKARLGVIAPKEVTVVREELVNDIQARGPFTVITFGANDKRLAENYGVNDANSAEAIFTQHKNRKYAEVVHVCLYDRGGKQIRKLVVEPKDNKLYFVHWGDSKGIIVSAPNKQAVEDALQDLPASLVLFEKAGLRAVEVADTLVASPF